MFAIIYQYYLKPESEVEYQQLWNTVANYFIQHCGAIGSSLHKTTNGTWLAYSRWPDKATRDAAWPGDNAPSETLPDTIRKAIIQMKQCTDETNKFPEIYMEVVDDLLFPRLF